jgi:ABC-type molybdate transport system substrate-binding protein
MAANVSSSTYNLVQSQIDDADRQITLLTNQLQIAQRNKTDWTNVKNQLAKDTTLDVTILGINIGL